MMRTGPVGVGVSGAWAENGDIPGVCGPSPQRFNIFRVGCQSARTLPSATLPKVGTLLTSVQLLIVVNMTNGAGSPRRMDAGDRTRHAARRTSTHARSAKERGQIPKRGLPICSAHTVQARRASMSGQSATPS